MARLSIRTGDWIVVCDGRKALVLANIGDAACPNFKTLEVLEHADSPTRELGTDAPGRVQHSASDARSSVEATDWHDLAERRFLTDLAIRLDAAVVGGETEGLFVVSPPRALGMIRQAYSPAVQAAIRAEVDRDLVHMPIAEIARHLAE